MTEYEYYSAFQKGPNTNTNIIQFSKKWPNTNIIRIPKNTQRRKVKQMQTVSLCLLWPKFFEETYEEAHASVERSKGNICEPLRSPIKAQNRVN